MHFIFAKYVTGKQKSDSMLINKNMRCPFLRGKGPTCLSNNTINHLLPIFLSTFLHYPFFFLCSALEQTWRVHLLDDFLYVRVCMKLLFSLQSYFQAVSTQGSVIQNSCHGIYLVVITMPISGMCKCIELLFLWFYVFKRAACAAAFGSF